MCCIYLTSSGVKISDLRESYLFQQNELHNRSTIGELLVVTFEKDFSPEALNKPIQIQQKECEKKIYIYNMKTNNG